MSRLAALAAALAACSSRAPLTSCDDSLRGVYAVDSAASPGKAGLVDNPAERWMLLDDGATLEAYPLTPDVPVAPGLEVAPRMLSLARAGGQLAGTLQRRYLQRTARCDARAAVHVTRCTGDRLELVVAGDPALPPPLSIAPCQLAAPASQVVRWRRD